MHIFFYLYHHQKRYRKGSDFNRNMWQVWLFWKVSLSTAFGILELEMNINLKLLIVALLTEPSLKGLLCSSHSSAPCAKKGSPQNEITLQRAASYIQMEFLFLQHMFMAACPLAVCLCHTQLQVSILGHSSHSFSANGTLCATSWMH